MRLLAVPIMLLVVLAGIVQALSTAESEEPPGPPRLDHHALLRWAEETLVSRCMAAHGFR